MPLPTGKVTFLFTDIEGSTKLWEKYPDDMRLALARHDEVAAEIIAHFNGNLVKSRGEGDSLFVVFNDPNEALSAALSLQLALAEEPWPQDIAIRIRMALHTGEAQLRQDDYYGPAVNRCARLRAIGYGNQILLSQTVFAAVCEFLPHNVSLKDMGNHRLKDLQQPEHVWQLLHPDLPADFPPLKSLNVLLHNLPQQVTSFIGREKETAEVRRLLGDHRLLTLTGSGGCGKTRLALQVAADLLDSESDGVWLVELAAISDPALLPSAVASVLKVQEEPGWDLQQTLLEYLKNKDLLLILDNCEHVLEACARLVSALLAGCPQVKILASSREGLGIAGEHTYRIPSLSLPDSKRLPPLETLLRYEAIRLFVDRAAAVNPAFAVNATNASTLVEVCQRLDGIPLAIELAATRIRALPLEQIASRLHDRFRILTGGSRAALPRQQTLRAMIDWSYDLLSDQEKALLRRLWVFVGGWTLDAAEQVCSGNEIEKWEILDLLTALVDKSLVVYTEQEGKGRYRLLETIRQYSRERRLTGESGGLLSAHSRYFLQVAREADALLRGSQQTTGLDILETEHDNLRVALEWCLGETGDKDDPLIGRHLAEAMWWFWDTRGYLKEGRGWLEKALASAPAHMEERAALLAGASNLAVKQKEYEAARAYAAESLAIRQELGDPEKIAVACTNLGNAAMFSGDFEQAQQSHLQSLQISRQLQNKRMVTLASNNLGIVAYYREDYSAARAYWQESLEALRQLDDRRSMAVTLNNLGELACKDEKYTEAKQQFMECLTLAEELGDRYTAVSALQFCAKIAHHQAKDVEAAQLWGIAEQIRETLGSPLTPEERQAMNYEAEIAEAQAAMGTDAFTAAWQSGRNMQIEQSLAVAQKI